MQNVIEISSDIYPVTYFFYFGKYPSVLTKYIKKKKHVKMKLSRMHTHLDPSGVIAICLDEYPNNPKWKGFLAHEIFHCVEFTFSFIEMKVNEESSEAYSYLIQYITEKIYEMFK